MGCKKCKKKDLEQEVKTNWTILLLSLFVMVVFAYGLYSIYFDLLSFFP
jgi:hypothetical protein